MQFNAPNPTPPKYSLQLLKGEKEPVFSQELISYRFDDGSSFPVSYVDFAKQYGYGRTCGEFFIYIPMRDYCDSFFNRCKAIKSTYNHLLNNPDDVWFDLKPDADFEMLKRLIPFAKSENGYYLFWDPYGSIANEMDIYITDFRTGFIKVARNLYELIDKMTSAQHFQEVFPLFRQQPLPATFEPMKRHSSE